MGGVTRRIRSTVKSIQRGQTAYPADDTITNVTISAVDVDKAFVSMSMTMFRTSGGSTFSAGITAYLTSSTNLAIELIGTDNAMTDKEIAWEVIEYE